MSDPKQKKLLFLAVGIFVIAGGVLYWIYFGSSGSAPVTAPVGSPVPSRAANNNLPGIGESEIDKIRLDTAVLRGKVLEDLTTYSPDLPVKVLQKGHPNPFQQFTSYVAMPPPAASSSATTSSVKTPTP